MGALSAELNIRRKLLYKRRDAYRDLGVAGFNRKRGVREEAAAVLAAMGLTVSDAFRMMMVRIAREKSLPFEPLVPNAETIEAMKEARRGGLPRFRTVDAMLAALNEGN